MTLITIKPNVDPQKIASTRWVFVIAALCALLAACDQKAEDATHSQDDLATATASGPSLVNSGDISAILSQSTLDALTLSLSTAKTLQNKINTLLNEPTPGHLKAAKAAWLEGVLAYRHATFQKHIALVEPINFSRINRLDYQIASYPIQPGFIDSYGPYKYSGLVHDIGFPINRESLENQHGLTDLGDVILGYYAIEFLLFNKGEERDLGDFVAIDTLNDELKKRGFEKTAEIPNNRRRALLKQQAAILVANLEELIDQWQVTQGAPLTIGDLPQAETEKLVHKALASAITQLLLELSGFTTDDTEKDIISSRITTASFDTQKTFIHSAIASLAITNHMLLDENNAKFDAQALKEAEALTGKDSPEKVEDKKAYWAEVFEKLKQASDSLPL